MTTHTITTGPFALTVAPDMGGAVLRLTHAGRDLLRDGRNAATVRETAGFPLIPFASRIPNGRFCFEGRDIRLTPNFPPEPHAIHGDCWQGKWTVADKEADRLTLTRDHDGTSWPWRYRAMQDFTLLPDGLNLGMSVTNLDNDPMPAGLGWHPFFPTPDAVLSANTTAIWTGDRAGPSPQPPQQDLSGKRPIANLAVDNVYCWPARQAVIELAHSTLHMTASPAFGQLIVCTTVHKDAFCVEPVSHAPNAVNLDLPDNQTGLVRLAAGETLSGTITLRLTQA